MIGAIVGAAAGFLLPIGMQESGSASVPTSDFALAATAGAIVGAPIGALLGLATGRRHWVSAKLPE